MRPSRVLPPVELWRGVRPRNHLEVGTIFDCNEVNDFGTCCSTGRTQGAWSATLNTFAKQLFFNGGGKDGAEPRLFAQAASGDTQSEIKRRSLMWPALKDNSTVAVRYARGSRHFVKWNSPASEVVPQTNEGGRNRFRTDNTGRWSFNAPGFSALRSRRAAPGIGFLTMQ
jgi:hypothetical protein